MRIGQRPGSIVRLGRTLGVALCGGRAGCSAAQRHTPIARDDETSLAQRAIEQARTRSANGAACAAKAVRSWLQKAGVRQGAVHASLCIEPESRWENGPIERFDGALRDERLGGEAVTTLRKARALLGRWRSIANAYCKEYCKEHRNTVRPHTSLGGGPPAPETTAAAPQASEHPHRPCTAYRGNGAAN